MNYRVSFKRATAWTLCVSALVCALNSRSEAGRRWRRSNTACCPAIQAAPSASPHRRPSPAATDAAPATDAAAPTANQPAAKSPEPAQSEAPNVIRLFDGKSLAGWKETQFGGQAEVSVKDGTLILPIGSDMTGVTWEGNPKAKEYNLPKDNYEIRLEAKRSQGRDFFCGITFPVGDAPLSLILGGWGGGVVGLSSIDGYDASENETTQFVEFENGRWYKIRLRVTPEKIEAWIDGEQLVDVERKGKKFSIRPEVDLSRPLGFSTWQTEGVLRNIVLVDLSKQK